MMALECDALLDGSLAIIGSNVSTLLWDPVQNAGLYEALAAVALSPAADVYQALPQPTPSKQLTSMAYWSARQQDMYAGDFASAVGGGHLQRNATSLQGMQVGVGV